MDIGTGDGLFVYHAAKENSGNLYIGIDPNSRQLEKISEKITRNPSKGGVPNVLYVQAAVENLPDELNGVANEAYILFPWGSLLNAVLTENCALLSNIRRICATRAKLHIMVALEKNKDQAEIKRLALPDLSSDYVESRLIPHYKSAGFDVAEATLSPFSKLKVLPTTWAKKLHQNKDRQLFELVAYAGK
ncbi:MAG TPA: class I SAM-dependent methyltransferase [Acidobacteriota bacterium]|nr:class I SAM-dependent methyltransferase [Acidobacteriota bacterium]